MEINPRLVWHAVKTRAKHVGRPLTGHSLRPMGVTLSWTNEIEVQHCTATVADIMAKGTSLV